MSFLEPEESEKWTVVPHDPNESTEWYFRRRLPEVKDLDIGNHPARDPMISPNAVYDYEHLQRVVKDLFNAKPPVSDGGFNPRYAQVCL